MIRWYKNNLKFVIVILMLIDFIEIAEIFHQNDEIILDYMNDIVKFLWIVYRLYHAVIILFLLFYLSHILRNKLPYRCYCKCASLVMRRIYRESSTTTRITTIGSREWKKSYCRRRKKKWKKKKIMKRKK